MTNLHSAHLLRYIRTLSVCAMLFAVAGPLLAGESIPAPGQSVLEGLKELAKTHGLTGWIAAGALALLLIFGTVLKSWITAAIDRLRKALYDRLAGTRLFQRFALAKYERALLAKFENVYVPFRQNLPPLKMSSIFVPLKVHAETRRRAAAHHADAQVEQKEEAVEVFDAIEKNRAMMVLGAPGSGKTMLLRHVALAYADYSQEYLADEPIPVLLELHRLAGEKKTVQEQLVSVFARNDFPRAERFVDQSLSRGTLILLLDGLDEVNSEARLRVVQQMKDLMDTHEKCRVIITCRVAVYRSEFADVVDKTLEIVEFNDQQVQQFLSAWQDEMPPGKSIEQLLHALHERPRIMTLARNPLLLTIIAFLYSDPKFILPRSRAEFYQKAASLLLELWHGEHNRYREREKRSVLRHLAIQFYDLAERQEKDRRSVVFQTVLEDVKAVLPSVDLDPATDAQPLLAEIVERSGLLLSIDGGERYQFNHLTLQEFFAAEALLGDEDTLFQRFQHDADAWREVVKLWCGLATDSTNLMRRVREIDPITAFECLADAQKVESVLVDQLLEEFQGKLSEGDEVIASFASVASDPHGRGVNVFEFLEETLRNDDDEFRRDAAATALSQTNRVEAAEILASVCDEQSNAIIHLSNMGDLAVPALSNRIRHADMNTAAGESTAVGALDQLEKIATPQAAVSLTPFLWDSNRTIATKAAWRLARMIRNEKIEDSLRTIPDWDSVAQTTALSWLWEPFGEPQRSPLSAFTGRVAELLSSVGPTSDETKRATLDERIVVPLATGLVSMDRSDDRESNNAERWKKLLEPDTREPLEARVKELEPRKPTQADWRTLDNPLKYEYGDGWRSRTADALGAGLTILVIGLATYAVWDTWWSLGTLAFMIPGVILCGDVIIWQIATRKEGARLRLTAGNLATVPWLQGVGGVEGVGWVHEEAVKEGCEIRTMMLIILPAASVVAILIAGIIEYHWMRVGLGAYVLVLALNGWLIRTALVLHRRARNPFAGLFARARRRPKRRRRRAWFRWVGERSRGGMGGVPEAPVRDK